MSVRFGAALERRLSRFTELMNFQLGAKAFNTFDTANFASLDTDATSSGFGRVIGKRDPRTFQFGIEFLFNEACGFSDAEARTGQFIPAVE